MTRGLDIGTMTIVSAEQIEKTKEMKYIDERDIFLELPKKAEEAEQFIDMAGEKLAKINDKTYVVGKSSVEFASFLGSEYNRPLRSGMINPDLGDEAIIILNLLIKSVLGEPREKNEIVAFSCPAEPIDEIKPVSYHRETIKYLLDKMGYEGVPVNEGMCIVYSHLMESGLTGLGLSFGAGMCNVSLSYKGMPVFEFSVARSGDWIDQQVQKATGKPTPEITYLKENEFSLDEEPTDRIKRYLRIYYEELVQYIIDKIIEKFESTKRIPPNLDAKNKTAMNLRMVIAGGTASVPGFAELLRKKVEESNFPLKVNDIFVPAEPLYVVSKGAYNFARKKRAIKK